MSLSIEEKQALATEIGKQAAQKVESLINDFNTKLEPVLESAKTNKGLTKEEFETLKTAQSEVAAKMESIAKAQGKELADLRAAISGAGTVKGESIASLLKKDANELAEIYSNGQGVATYEVFMNKGGEVSMRRVKTAYSHATIDDVDNGANVASIASSLDASAILRLGGDAPVVTQYRNSPYIFDLCNTITVNSGNKLAIWIDEKDKEGASSAVTEGSTKPKSQYFYEIKNSAYKKEATLLTFTEEFDMDFARLQQESVNSARVDLTNRINTAIQARIISAATAYNTGDDFKTAINLGTDPNDFDAIAAMAAQADSATFGGSMTNAALMSTYKKYGMGLTKDSTFNYLNTPDIIKNVSFVGNAGMAADDVVVGDFKQYNIQLRGGMIMKVGYNGTDFAENKFSVVLEQYYFDYISSIRAKALVKGQTFATVKAAIATA
jgi:hypothetical protein